MSEELSIQWFPGHMTKAKRKIQQNLKLVDGVAEIIDARVPVSSRNPDFDELLNSKPRILLMNKCDVADNIQTAKWLNFYRRNGIEAIDVDCKSGKNLNKFIPTIRRAMKGKIDSWRSKGMAGHVIRIMVVGIPNVGKSSFINKMVKSNRAKVEDRPGVTRGNQWFTIAKGIELLDTPGILWPKFDDAVQGQNLAFTGAVKDEVTDTEQLAVNLIEFLKTNCPESLICRFKLSEDDMNMSGREILKSIGKKRGKLISGGEVDIDCTSTIVLDEFRAGKLGRITLEKFE